MSTSPAIRAVELHLARVKDAAFELSSDDLAIIEENRGLIECINPKSKIVAIGCSECGRVGFMTTGATPKCRLTMGCSGKPLKITAAERVDLE